MSQIERRKYVFFYGIATNYKNVFISIFVFLFGFYLNYELSFRFHTFQIVDDSLVLDMAWKLLNGQKPFDDFSTNQGLSPAIIEAGFIKLFGVSLKTQVLHVSFINGAASALVFIALRMIGGGYLIPFVMACFTSVVFYPPERLAYAVQHGVFFSLIGLVLAILVERKNFNLINTGMIWACIGGAVSLSFLSKQTTLALFLALIPFFIFRFSKTAVVKIASFALGCLLPFAFIILISTNSMVTIFQMKFYLLDLALGLGSVRVGFHTLHPLIIFDLWRNPFKATILMTTGIGLVALYFSYKARRPTVSSLSNITMGDLAGNVLIIWSGLGLILGTTAIAWIAWWPKENLMQLPYLAVGIVSIGLLNVLSSSYNFDKLKHINTNIVYFLVVIITIGWEVAWVHLNINLRSGFPNTPQLVGEPHDLTRFMLPKMAGAQFRSLLIARPKEITIGANKISQKLLEAQETQDLINSLNRNVLLIGLPKFHYAYAEIASPLPVAQLIPGAHSPASDMPEYHMFLRKLGRNIKRYNIQDLVMSSASFSKHKKFIRLKNKLFCNIIIGKQVVHVQLCNKFVHNRSMMLAHLLQADTTHYLKAKGYEVTY